MDTQLPPVISADWLAERKLRAADTAAASGRSTIVVHVGTTMTGHDPHQTYLDGHLPDARYVSLDDDLAGPPAPIHGRHPLPDADAFNRTLERLGIGVDDAVVAYDDRNGAFAARLVWMLRILDQPAALLDGGRERWTGEIVTGSLQHTAVDRPTFDWPARALADADDVAAHLAAGGIVVDSREAARYAGDVEPIDLVAGHVPGAINLPFADNVVDGRWRAADALRDRFAPLADDPDAIVYCGSGVTACHNALAIEAAGMPRPRVYVGSWSGWSSDSERPVATGHAPG